MKPTPIAVDTSIIVAALLSWHEHHEIARERLEAASEAGSVVLPIPALVEAYAVMTRLPAPHRLGPAEAHRLLHGNFAGSAQVAGLTGRECWAMLAELAAEATAGGRTYDAHILQVAVKANAVALLTLNSSDFLALARGRIEIRSPLD